MLTILNKNSSIINQLIAELRQGEVQNKRLDFRFNLERLGELFAYEISKILNYKKVCIETPFGEADELQLQEQPVLGTIIRAGLPLHQGMLRLFDQAESAFFAVYRKTHKNHEFQVEMKYLSAPQLNNKVLIVSDAVIGSGKSMVLTCQEIKRQWNIKTLHIVAAIASEEGLAHVRAFIPDAHVWIGALDKELTSKSYIVPGLGDAGDIAFGKKSD